jgi:serine/threonine protein kinase
VTEPGTELAISNLGGLFAGTSEFASPEQFAGLGLDIRSSLYSLGVTLWEMLAGQVPFGGSSTEVTPQGLRTVSGRQSAGFQKTAKSPLNQ